jgi:mono/diheme cytochrome c family protein
MLAYPRLRPEHVGSITKLLGVGDRAPSTAPPALDASERTRVTQLWAACCAACHAGALPVSGRGPASLALYSADWIFAYANGQAQGLTEPRQMPIVSVTREDAASLYQLLGELRAEQETALDERVRQLSLAATPQRAVPETFVTYLWGRFFRDATCVHCHATSPRAARAFRADAQGLKEYLERKSGEEFWRRLEIRALEAEAGLGADTPGMPMAGVELPAPLRQLIGAWVRAGCKAPDGQSYCRSSCLEHGLCATAR